MDDFSTELQDGRIQNLIANPRIPGGAFVIMMSMSAHDLRARWRSVRLFVNPWEDLVSGRQII